MARKEKKLLNTDYTSVMSPKLKVAVVVSNFNSRITERLLKGAVDFFMSCGMNKNQIQILYVPGAFEIPQVCARLCEKRKVRGIVTLGAVIRGETTHYDYVCSESARG
ncbi:MAG: 6,7-dimethyl-8-ribityllumazine synthase, partial [Candidatus Aureabacteria bacterium]|nr:6,7-dimethyl-8-ribityllumazine synthase [Candidatus Auribacterota bacterium]